VKRGKRYRYYISQAAIHHRATATGPTRIPPEEIESLVCRRIQSLLTSPEQLLQSIGVRADGAATSKLLISAGKQLTKIWQEKSPAEHREFLSAVIARIVVHEATLEIAMIQSMLREVLLGDRPSRLASLERPSEKRTKDVFKLIVDAKVKRCGGEVRLLVPADSATQAPARHVPSLIKAIARAHPWPEKIIRGELTGLHSIAELIGLDEHYAGRILNCSFLAPDIVEAILDGRQPPDLTVQKLLHGLPLSWAEQREQRSRDFMPHFASNPGSCGV
jgi:site-specific DNA recombinase